MEIIKCVKFKSSHKSFNMGVFSHGTTVEINTKVVTKNKFDSQQYQNQLYSETK